MNDCIPTFNKSDLPALWHSTIGLERETLRVTSEGKLATTSHSDEWGARYNQPYIQTDFGESQLELITPPAYSAKEIYQWLSATHQIVAQTNWQQNEKEYLWPFSTPGLIPENRDSILIAQLEDKTEYQYRDFLAKHYGKDVQLLTGIHYNYKINPAVVANICGSEGKEANITCSNRLYGKLARNYMRYRWILTYLLSAAPFIDPTYGTELYGAPHKNLMRSFRQSRYGYQNEPSLEISYESLEAFVDDLEKAVDRKDLSVEKELYRDVRFRRSTPVRHLIDEGIDYLEFRNFDINPYDAYGMTIDDMEFIRLFIIAMLYLPDVKTDKEVTLGHHYHIVTAEDGPLSPPIIKDEAQKILDLMKELAIEIDQNQLSDVKLTSIVEEKLAMLEDPALTLAGKIFIEIKEVENFVPFAMKLAQTHQQTYLENPYALHGFEAFELSTQDVIKEAIRHGIEVDVIDSKENLIRLTYNDHIEYVKNGNMTQYDTLISYYLMENKVATKELLDQAGIKVPQGVHFDNEKQAKAYYSQLSDQPFVIKPKNTNYGLGITIFTKKGEEEEYLDAVDFAFAEDSTILIEEFAAGTELRFYVQDNEVKAVVERQPAQVKADGQASISELIDAVNDQPLRGKKHLAPLTWIEKGSAEITLLKEQGLTLDSVPEKDTVVYLRRNSNISTGGLSIDRTDEVHPSYAEIAVASSKALGANFCGVDIIMENFREAATDTNYHVIEANFNPMITLHRYPAIGKKRPVGRWVLESLFPEITFNDSFAVD